MLKRLAVLLVSLGAFALTPNAFAADSGGPVDCQKDILTGTCLIAVITPGLPAPASHRKALPSGSCYFLTLNSEQTVPCSSQYGRWANSENCYLKLASPQPVMGDPIWRGHTDGSLYDCTNPNGLWTANGLRWLPIAPPAVIDPAILAQQAMTAMKLKAIKIGITPEPGPGSIGYVGLPTYLWVDQPGPQTIGPISRSASAGGVTVTATARVARTVWTMGDGGTVTCRGAGTPYQDAFGATPSPTCGYQYTQTSAGHPGEAFPVTATSHWTIDWAGGGQNGTINMDLTARTQVRIGEAQVLIQ